MAGYPAEFEQSGRNNWSRK